MKADLEVERVLREIQENLHAETEARHKQNTDAYHHILLQLESNLRVTARAWNRLPPVSSDRRGLKARIEVWIKRQLKRATNWLTWEQVNFNGATDEALRNIHQLLVNYEKQQNAIRNQLEEITIAIQQLKTDFSRK